MNIVTKSSLENITELGSRPRCIVLMSSFNGEHFIVSQIESIINQRHVDVSLIVRDDGSNDKTISILEDFKKKYPSLIDYYVGENIGISRSFADLIRKCPKTDYVAFADQDDVWDLDKLYIGIALLKKYSLSFYSSASRLVDQNLTDLKITTSDEEKYKHYMFGNNKLLTPGVQGCTMIIRFSFFERVIASRYPDYYGHDEWMTPVSYFFEEAIYDCDAHMSYRQHDNSWTGNRSKVISRFFKTFKSSVKYSKRYKQIAQDILKRYSDSIKENDKNILHCFSDKKPSFFKRNSFLRKNRINKYGFFSNLLFKFAFIFSNK